MLLKHGADPNVTGRRETSLLHHMAATGKVWGRPHLKEDERMTWYRVKAVNHESIHAHNAFAVVESPPDR